MADYWDEHADAEEPVEDVMDFVRRMVTGQLPSHWHLDDFADLRHDLIFEKKKVFLA